MVSFEKKKFLCVHAHLSTVLKMLVVSDDRKAYESIGLFL